MELFDITTDNSAELSGILEDDVRESIGRKYYCGKVLMDDLNDPMGCLVWEYKNVNDETDTQAEIIHFSTRDEEAGKELLDAFDLASGQIGGKSYIHLPASQTDLTGLLAGQGFSVKQQESRDIFLTVDELSQNKIFQKRPSSYVFGLDEISGREFRQGIMKCLFYGKRGLLEDIATLPMTWYDLGISCVARADEEVTGLLLVHRFPSGILMPCVLFASGPDAKTDLLDLMRFSVQAAARDYPGDTKVLIRRDKSFVRGLAEKLFPGKQGETAIYGERLC